MSDGGKSEINTVRVMIGMYCRHHHQEEFCDECRNLHEYAVKSIGKCPFGADKPVCSECRVHCYKPDMRERIRKIMKYAGPRMIYRHPFLALKHLAKKSRRR
jgi:hypothetical protein